MSQGNCLVTFAQGYCYEQFLTNSIESELIQFLYHMEISNWSDNCQMYYNYEKQAYKLSSSLQVEKASQKAFIETVWKEDKIVVQDFVVQSLPSCPQGYHQV